MPPELMAKKGTSGAGCATGDPSWTTGEFRIGEQVGKPGLIAESEICCVIFVSGTTVRTGEQGNPGLLSESEISHAARTLDLFERRRVATGDKHTDSQLSDESKGSEISERTTGVRASKTTTWQNSFSICPLE